MALQTMEECSQSRSSNL